MFSLDFHHTRHTLLNNLVRNPITQTNLFLHLLVNAFRTMAATYAQTMAPRDVNSHMTFLARNELYQTEKPYTTDFPVDDIEGAKMTNQIFDTQPVLFHDARVAKEPLTLDQNGFCFVKAKTSLKAEEATPEKTELMEQYLQEVAGILQEKFPQYKEVKSLDFQVCRLLFTAVMRSN